MGQYTNLYQGCTVANDSTKQYAYYRFHIPDIKSLGQGTAQAVEGALALGAALAGAGPETDLAPRLRLYEASRRERAAAILAARIDVTERGARGGRVDEVGEHLALGFMEATFDPL